jgi:1-hydroxycarotenoid 3,4-desaturase
MRWVFEELFDRVGESLSACLPLTTTDVLARHIFDDRSGLDLFADPQRSETAIEDFAGAEDAENFRRFSERAKLLFSSFEGPMMRQPRPRVLGVTSTVLGQLTKLLPAMGVGQSLWTCLAKQFRDPRLTQLFGRYATYVGGSPFHSPALLMLIWHAEASGVSLLPGGMITLTDTLEALCLDRGVEFKLGSPATRIHSIDNKVRGVSLQSGEHLDGETILFGGDPSALGGGLLGDDVRQAAPQLRPSERALSAMVWTFAAKASGFNLSHHNVFFGNASETEFGDIFTRRRLPRDPTVYVCAQDRGFGTQPQQEERFQFIVNAPADGDLATLTREDMEQCQNRTFQRLEKAGLRIPMPEISEALTTPQDFANLFPGTGGALYGAHPHGTLKAFTRPTARTRIRGLYLAGGGCHPGPGVPMACLSGQHAAAAILQDRPSTYRSARTATPGGISTASRTVASGASPSSVS